MSRARAFAVFSVHPVDETNMSIPELTKICLVCCALTFPVFGAPKGRNKIPQTVYDQKQTGDYNIQLHLKDFQIIALLADDTLGNLGDYDYSYDYSDFTIKPVANSSDATTAKPTVPTTSSETTTTVTPSSTSIRPSSTALPEVVNNTEKIVLVESTTEKLDSAAFGSPDKIKVQIIQTPVNPNLEIVPADDAGPSLDSIQALGEVMHYKRCALGYSRDKRGRCRRIRKPGVPFSLGRLASNLAAKFRQASGEEEAPSVPPYPVEEESDITEE